LSNINNHNGGAAIACGNVVAIDSDINDRTLAYEVQRIIIEVTGGRTISRVGNHPRETFFFRNEDKSIKKRVFEVENGEQVEILGYNCNCMIYGRHYSTGKPYQWYGGSPLNTPVSKLPLITEDQIQEIGVRIANLRKDLPKPKAKLTDNRDATLRDMRRPFTAICPVRRITLRTYCGRPLRPCGRCTGPATDTAKAASC